MPRIWRCSNTKCGHKHLGDETVAATVTCRKCSSVMSSSGGSSGSPSRPSNAKLQSVGRFQIREVLGAGSFGTVYRAYDPQLDREVALKVPNAGTLDSPKRVERFLREAKAAANLHHPNIVPVYESGQIGAQYYIVSSYIAAQTLSELIDDNPMDFKRAAQFTRQLAEALAYAHEEGVVHRDVKPANVLVDQHDRIHLMDFGLAARQDEASRLTNDGAVMGTPAYMAPEQAGGQQGEVKPAADQYAVGVTLYELICGRPPFLGSPHVVLHQQLNSEPDRPSKLRPSTPRDLETICLKAMDKRPEGRYPDCAALAEDLRRWLHNEPITARPAGTFERTARWAANNRLVAGLIGAVAASLLLGFVVSLVLAFQWQERAVAANEALGTAREQTERAEAATKKAEEERENAIHATNVADQARRDAEAEKERANKLRDEAEKARKTADDALALSERDRKLADLSLKEKEFALGKVEQEKKEKETAYAKLAEAVRSRDEQAALALAGANKLLEKDKFEQAKNEVRIYAQKLKDVETLLVNRRAAQAHLELNGLPAARRGWEHSFLVQRCDHFTVPKLRQEHTKIVSAVAFSPDGKRLVSVGCDNCFKVWDLEKEKVLWTQDAAHGNWLSCVAFSPDGKQFVTGGYDRMLYVWNASEKKKPIYKLPGHTDRVTSVAYSPDGKYIVSGSWDKSVRLWDAATGKQDRAVGTHTHQVWCVAYSPDGKWIASGGQDNTCKLWDAVAGKDEITFKGHQKEVAAICFDPNGKWFATASNDMAVRVWDIETRNSIHVLEGHTGVVTTLCTDGKRIVSGGVSKNRMGEIKVWDATYGVELLNLVGHENQVSKLAFSPDGTQLASSGFDRDIFIWKAK